MTTLRSNPIPCVVLTLAAAFLPTQAQVPSEVTTLTWCAGPAKDCLQWSASDGAAEYRLYRGELASLACLPNTARESCLESVFTDSTTGPGAITENPEAGRFYWYLLTAANAQAEGTSGTERLNGVSQPRVRNSVGACPVTCSPAGGGCSTASDCCSSACFAGCQAACCVPAGGACTDYFDCCTGNCNNGTCQSCFAMGQACAVSAQCCSGACNSGYCGVACEEDGGTCASNSQCCSGNCVSGTCQAPPTDDGVATVVPDVPAAASATIGRAGGSIQAGGLTLTIPPGALSEDALITMTPLSDMADSPIEGLVIGAAAFEPDGLLLLKPATLTMPLPAGVFPLDVLGFASAGDGSDLHLEQDNIQANTISLMLWHFSTAGAASGGEARRQSLATYTPTTEQLRAIQTVTAACVECAAEVELFETYTLPGCTRCEEAQIRELVHWYQNTVKPGLEAAVGAPSFQVEPALQEWLVWAAKVPLRDFIPIEGLQNEYNQAIGLATTAVQDMANRRMDNCTGTTPDSQLHDVARMVDFSVAGALTLDPPVEGMLRECMHLAINEVSFPLFAAVGSDHNTLTGRVVLDPHVGPDRTLELIPHFFTVNGSSQDHDADGHFSKTFNPSGPTLVINMHVEGTTDPWLNADFFGDASISVPTRPYRFAVGVKNQEDPNFWNEYYLRPGETGVVRSRLAGDGINGATVTYELTGIGGSLNLTTVVSDANGRPPDVTYTPPPNTIGDVTITATALGETAIGTFHLHGPPIITSVSPSPMVAPGSGIVTVYGSGFHYGYISTDGPLLLNGNATIDPDGHYMSIHYSIGDGVEDGTTFHFFVDTPWGQASILDSITTN